ncbi:MAG: hypothetical protein RL026_2674 [Pseudomonadota bacterium]
MDNLRWILLGAGLVFLAVLLVWELLRRRHAVQSREATPQRREPALDTVDLDDEVLRVGREGDLRRDPPVVRLEALDAGESPLRVAVHAEVAVDRPRAALPTAVPDEESVDELDEGALGEVEEPPAVIHWPPLEQEQILWLRVLPRAEGGRFGGRPVRQALVGRGLVLGPQDIFHWVDRDGRVIASVASLTRPGGFVMSEMDNHSYAGLNLFSVLPGPLPERRTFEELLGLARDLAARLGGELFDDQGLPLDDARLAQLRGSLRAPAGDAV